jgi:membrane-associated PAP2 superfamily phosphatase
MLLSLVLEARLTPWDLHPQGGGTPYIKVYGEARRERVYFSVKAGQGMVWVRVYFSLYSGKGYVFLECGLGKGRPMFL